MLDSIIFCSTLALCDSLHSLLCRYTLFLSCTPTFVNWALPANKLRVMCRVFIKNMLEKHTPIKDSVFYAERGAEHRVREEELSEAAASLRGWICARCCGLPRLRFGSRLFLSSTFPWCHFSQEGCRGEWALRWCRTQRTAPQPGHVLQASSLFLHSINDVNAGNSPSSQDFFLWLMWKVAIAYTSGVTLLILIHN